ncbi:MAG: ligase-associated DNA damage response exonuclease [Planctomycetota bacterium]
MPVREPLLVPTDRGVYCPPGGFHIDPWRAVERAVVTHAHADHLHPGSRCILCSKDSEHVTRVRAGAGADLTTLGWGETVAINEVTVSVYPAGHILGSAQVRVEHGGEVWVASGDYKFAPGAERPPDPTAVSFEPVRCDTFITESTFGLPIFRWRDPWSIIDEVLAWWRGCIEDGRNAIVFTYALGKAQRVMRMLAEAAGDAKGSELPGPILVHGAMVAMCEAYERSGVVLPAWEKVTVESAKAHKGRALVIAPPSAGGTPWVRKLHPFSDASVSGWSQIRGTRRRRAIDRGFVISDHADWPGILGAIEASGCDSVGVTHGSVGPMSRYLNEHGVNAWVLPTRWEGEGADDTGDAEQEQETAG